MGNLLRAVWCSIFRCPCLGDDCAGQVKRELRSVELRVDRAVIVTDNRISEIMRRLEEVEAR